MNKVDHIGIAVIDLEEGIKKYEQIYQQACFKIEVVESEFVRTAFFQLGETKVELLQAIDNKGPIAIFIEKKGEGIHHIAYEVTDIRKEMLRFAEEGFRVLSDEPKRGADNKWVCFIHPKDTNGVLTELVQSIE